MISAATLPKVSILVSLYNCEAYIEECLASVARQTYTKLECVIVDDCSTDSSAARVAQMLSSLQDERFHFYRQEKNEGQMSAIKKAMELSDPGAPFVILLDADDVLADDCVIQHLRAHLNGGITAALSFGDMFQINSNGEVIAGTYECVEKQRFRGHDARGRIVAPSPADIFGTSDSPATLRSFPPETFDWVFPPTSGLMFRRSFLRIAIPDSYRQIRICADYYLIVLAQYLTGSIGTEAVVASYRRHSANNYSYDNVLGGLSKSGNHSVNMSSMQIGLMLDHVLGNLRTFCERTEDTLLANLLVTVWREDPSGFRRTLDAIKRMEIDDRDKLKRILLLRHDAIGRAEAKELDRKLGGNAFRAAVWRLRLARLPPLARAYRALRAWLDILA